jgi:5-methylcytosine-specific restriction protein A
MPKRHRPATSQPPRPRAEIHADYDRNRRNPERARFYRSKEWRALRDAKIRRNPLCERCLIAGNLTKAEIVHHKKEIHDRPDLRLNIGNLESVCQACHNREHKGKDE